MDTAGAPLRAPAREPRGTAPVGGSAPPDRRAGGSEQALIGGMQLFAHFFAWPKPRVFDPYITTEAQPLQPHQALGQLLDPDLVAHVQHKQPAGRTERRR